MSNVPGGLSSVAAGQLGLSGQLQVLHHTDETLIGRNSCLQLY